MSSPTSRSLDALRKDGWTAAVVERWNPHAKIRQDLFHCIDVLAIKPGCGNLAVQACAGSSHAARREKSIREPKLITWLAASKDNHFEVWSWAKQGPRGKRKLWTLRREELTGMQVVNETLEPEMRSAQHG